jgi:sterol desaturase/sphingolipid hydroxylase (fatty acid hydroxylase superfamily)
MSLLSVIGANMMFLVEPMWEWCLSQLVVFTFLTLLFLQALDFFPTTIFSLCGYRKEPLFADKGSEDEDTASLKPIDYCYIWFNKLFTVGFNNFLMRFCWNRNYIIWKYSEVSLLNSVGACVVLFLLHDFFYYVWHRLLHLQPLYKSIHQHHHRTYSPHRGSDDATNSNPIEYIVTAFLIPVSIILVPCDCHILAIVLFTTLYAFFAAINHSRLNVGLLRIYLSGRHDQHHRAGKHGGNYAQYVWVYDSVFGTLIPRAEKKDF